MVGNWHPREMEVVEKDEEAASDEQSTHTTANLLNNWSYSSAQAMGPSSGSSSSCYASNFGNQGRTNSAGGTAFLPEVSFSKDITTAQPPKQISQTSTTPASPADLPSSSEDLQFTHPQTGRPARQLLDHEKSLLDEFYMLKNPSASQPAPHKAEKWRLDLPVHEIEEWNDFVFKRQSKSQARLRKESVKAHGSVINDIKEREELANRRTARQEYFARRGSQHSRRKLKKTGKKQAFSKAENAEYDTVEEQDLELDCSDMNDDD